MSSDSGVDLPPEARLASQRPGAVASRYWILTAACLVAAIGLVFWAYRESGPQIIVRFDRGHGIKAGDRLRHRGIEVGEVTQVALTSDFQGVEIRITLVPSAAGLAREGSLFWVERPQIGLGRMRGLDTVVGAKYISVLPGDAEGAPQGSFRGEEFPLAIEGTQLREVVVRFEHGNGLTIGDPLRHRGITVGEVVGIDLVPNLSKVEVRVRLQGFASQLARAGSRFWVERPRLSLSGVGGLETVVGGRYLAVQAGPEGAAEVDLFDGLESPPVARPGGLEVVLESTERFGVEVGAPVAYRGMQVGSITSVGLSTDSTRVETTIQVEDDYRALVCPKSKFWSTGGIGIDVGLTGVELNAETLQTIAAGGIAFATPDEPGDPVSTGHRFQLDEKAQSAWLAWAPRLVAGPTRLPDGSALPGPQSMTISWQVKQLGWRRQRRRQGLAVLLTDGRWLGPPDLFTPPAEALPDSARLEFAGQQHIFAAANRGAVGNASTYRQEVVPNDAPRWPADKTRGPTKPEDSLIVAAAQVVPLPAHRLTESDGVWNIDSSFAIAPEWHGASIVAAADGCLIAVLEVDSAEGTARALLLAK